MQARAGEPVESPGTNDWWWPWDFGAPRTGSGSGDRLIVRALVIAMPGGGDLGDMLLRPVDETVEKAGRVATEIGELVVNAHGDRRVQRPSHQSVVVLDLVGGDYGERSLPTLRARGVLVTPADPMNRHLAGKAEEAGVRFAGIMVEPDHVALESLADLVDDRRLRVHLERTFAFDDIAEAHRYVEGGHMTGKVVLLP